MTLRQVQLNKAYSLMGWEPLPYLEIYDKDDTADYSRLLKRIGHGQALVLFAVCICVYDRADETTITHICLWFSSDSMFTRSPFLTLNSSGVAAVAVINE